MIADLLTAAAVCAVGLWAGYVEYRVRRRSPAQKTEAQG